MKRSPSGAGKSKGKGCLLILGCLGVLLIIPAVIWIIVWMCLQMK